MVANLILALATLTIGDLHSSNCAAAPAQVQVRTAPLHIQLQIVPAVPVTEKLVRTIVSTAAAIWAPYNVHLAPVSTPSGSEMDGGIWLTLVLGYPPARSAEPGLASLLFTADGPGTVLYASLDRARSLVQSVERGTPVLAAQADWLAAVLLGRAVAHELGHYLLRSREHAKTGLMRAAFSPRDASNAPRFFRLLPGQVAALASTCEMIAGR